MGPEALEKISHAVVCLTNQLRDLNLSYNRINLSTANAKDFEMSYNFMTNVLKLLEEGKILNHLNLSGMNLSSMQIFDVCRQAAESRLIMSLHLSDNGITTS